MRRVNSLAFAFVALFVFCLGTVPAVADGPWFKPALLLEASDTDGAAKSLSASDTIAAVGAPSYRTVYVYDAITGERLQTIHGPASVQDDSFGDSVAVLGRLVIVGAPWDDAGARNAGIVYIFDALTGSLRHTIANPNPVEGDEFGDRVAASENHLVVLAQGSRGVPRSTGAIHIFDVSGLDISSDKPRLTLPVPAHLEPSDSIGMSLATSERYIVVGAAGRAAWAGAPERVYVFEPTTGRLLCTISAPDQATGSLFGISVTVDSARVLVGAPYATVATATSGEAYLFTADTGRLLHRFRDPTPANNQNFGEAVGLRGGNALVGAPWARWGGVPSVGEAHLFDATSGSLVRTFSPRETIGCDHFAVQDGEGMGYSVVVTAEALVVAPFRVPGVAAYVFRRSPVRQLRVMARSAGGPDGLAAFYVDGVERYSRRGSDGGGRGFNVAAIDLATGQALGPHQHFDTWANNRLLGDKTLMGNMAAFLYDLPVGTLIMIAVADDAGLTEGLNRCRPLSFQGREAGLQALKDLGSTQIENYCFRGSWAMIAIKGQGIALAEQLGKGGEVCVTATIPVP